MPHAGPASGACNLGSCTGPQALKSHLLVSGVGILKFLVIFEQRRCCRFVLAPTARRAAKLPPNFPSWLKEGAADEGLCGPLGTGRLVSGLGRPSATEKHGGSVAPLRP